MRTLFSIAVLISASMPAFAIPTNPIPEPESLSLLAVAVVAMLVARRRK
ncbi:PEP-CTERM sorting domain-containing protein [Candidatus Accumulibacter aalborgensis]|nr:PEP-CTERM sorting domain-containing protein [Candidatus Accumulibacter aalborgensis]